MLEKKSLEREGVIVRAIIGASCGLICGDKVNGVGWHA
jgi:hypothetical protein